MDEKFDVLDKWGVRTGEVAGRDRCHIEGLWHRAVVVFVVSTDNQRVLLQKRSAKKKLWPNCWDLTAGGHVLAGEIGYQAAVRETEEEIGLELKPGDLLCIGSSISENIKDEIINRHFNEYYVVHKDVDPALLKLQPEEVQEVRWVDWREIRERVRNGYDGLTDKIGCWESLLDYLESIQQ